MLKVTVKFVLAVIQLVLSAVSLMFCVKLLLDVCRSGESEKDSYSDPEEKIMFLDF